MKAVEVQLPVVKLRVDDLGYLRGLQMQGKDSVIRCTIPQGNFSRLLVLGLVEHYKQPPCPDAVAKFEGLRKETLATLHGALRAKPVDWKLLNSLSIHRCTDGCRPGPRESIRITAAGEALIKDGTARVQIGTSCR